MDPALLMWVLRIQETEALLNARQQEHAAQSKRRAALEQQLHLRERDKVRIQQRLLTAQRNLAQGQLDALACREQLAMVRDKAEDGDRLTKLLTARRELDERLGRVEASVAAEEGRQGSYAQLAASYGRELEEAGDALQAALDKATHRLSQARERHDLGQLGRQLVEQRDRREQLQAQLHERRTAVEGLQQEVAQLQEQVAARERSNVECVNRDQAALRDGRAALATTQRRTAEAQHELTEARSQRLVLANRVAELQRATEAARTALACLDASVPGHVAGHVPGHVSGPAVGGPEGGAAGPAVRGGREQGLGGRGGGSR